MKIILSVEFLKYRIIAIFAHFLYRFGSFFNRIFFFSNTGSIDKILYGTYLPLQFSGPEVNLLFSYLDLGLNLSFLKNDKLNL